MAKTKRSGAVGDPLGKGASQLRRHGNISFGLDDLGIERPAGEEAGITWPGAKKKRRRLPVGALLMWSTGAVIVAVVVVLAQRAAEVDVTQDDLADGAALNAEALEGMEVQIELDSADTAKSTALYFDGEEVERPRRRGANLHWRPPDGLEEGDHELSVRVPRVLLPPSTLTWDFTYDTTPPAIEVPRLWDAVGIEDSVTVNGTVEAGSELEGSSGEAEVDEDGNFTVSFSRAPAGPVRLNATDPAGNRAHKQIIVPVTYAGTRSVQVSAAAWSGEGVRSEILRMADEGRIDAVILDAKDETGRVGFGTTVQRAQDIGAVTRYYDMGDAADALHERDARLIVRVAAFNDPVLAEHAWSSGQQGQVIRGADGQPYGSGNSTNFAHPDVQQYNIDIAVDALEQGADEILWDEVSQPVGDLSQLQIANLNGPASDAIGGWLARAHVEARRRGAYQGVVALGLAADRGEMVGQDVALLARHADYIVPVIHPLYWTPGEHGVANPGGQPREFVTAVLEAFKTKTEPSATALMPSLQSGFGGYGAAEVRAEIQGARSAGVESFVLYSPNSRYMPESLDPTGS